MEENYSMLEKREVAWFSIKDHKYGSYTGIVVGCEFDIGITIVNKDNKEHNLTCLNGPSSPHGQFGNDEMYKALFLRTIDMINAGHVDPHVLNVLHDAIKGMTILTVDHDGYRMADCAFDV